MSISAIFRGVLGIHQFGQFLLCMQLFVSSMSVCLDVSCKVGWLVCRMVRWSVRLAAGPSVCLLVRQSVCWLSVCIWQQNHTKSLNVVLWMKKSQLWALWRYNLYLVATGSIGWGEHHPCEEYHHCRATRTRDTTTGNGQSKHFLFIVALLSCV